MAEIKKNSDYSTELAIDRSRLAAERTLMAWVRIRSSHFSFAIRIRNVNGPVAMA
jgi:uncharacterized membrane protein YidH (DUF202 family)